MSVIWQELEGTAIDAYPLVRLLGATERSAVYLTTRESGQRRAAIKLMAAEAGTAYTLLQRWKERARLSHPHVVRVFDAGRGKAAESDVVYVTMEYAEEVLGDVLRERCLTGDEVKALIGPCLAGLDYLHGKGLGHAELRPSNIVSVGEVLKISCDGAQEFGAALERDAYGAPEGKCSVSGDLWSLGRVIVSALGRQPEGEWEEITRRCLHEDPRSRGTVEQIRSRLGLAAPVKAKRSRYLMAGVAGAAVLAAVVVWPRFMEPAKDPEPVAAQAPVPVAVPQAAPVAAPVAPPPAPKPEPEPPPPVVVKAKVEPKSSEAEASRKLKLAPQNEEQVKRKVDPPPRGAVMSQGLPDVPGEVLNTINGSVRVSIRVEVDEAGNVSASRIQSAGPSRYFAGLAERSSRQWKFTPAAPGRWVIRYEFTPEGVKASAIPE